MIRYVYALPVLTEQVQQVFPLEPKLHEDGSEWVGGYFTDTLRHIEIRFLIMDEQV